MINVTTAQRLIQTLDSAADILGPDATLRQVIALLHVAAAGSEGIDGTTLERKTDSSQATTSRTLKLFGPGVHGLTEFFLDQLDGRRRLVRLVPKGTKAVTKILGNLAT